MSRWRTLSLVLVHVIMIGHMVHWVVSGRTLSPVEPSEAMYTLNEGHLNAGFIFFAASLLATLVLGRFVCGWGCHFIAYQDLCTWLLKKIGIKPKPLRSRLLILAPLALAIYMFVWPTAYRLWMGVPAPALSNHLLKTDYWETFPGPVIAIVSVLVCGIAVVYFLGSKGFCTYGCPYGGFFALTDKVAPGRILVTDACEQCGHCTATCSSNVRVHEEVARYGMVVDPGCMKCMDCVSVCPKDALHFGFARPSIVGVAKSPLTDEGTVTKASRQTHYDFSLGEEAAMASVGLLALLCVRGLYGQIPLLLAMGMGGISAYIFGKVLRLVRSARFANVRFQNLQLKRGGEITRAGWGFTLGAVALGVFTFHSGLVQYHAWRGELLTRSLSIDDSVWSAGNTWWTQASSEQRTRVVNATTHLERVNQWGLMPTPATWADLTWLYLAQDRDAEAEGALRQMIAGSPDQAEPYRGLAGVLRKTGRMVEAQAFYEKTLSIDPAHDAARADLAGIHYDRGMAQLGRRAIEAAIASLQAAVHLLPGVAIYQYNLGVATFMAGRPRDALPHIREAIRLNPNDPDAQGFEQVILQELNRK